MRSFGNNVNVSVSPGQVEPFGSKPSIASNDIATSENPSEEPFELAPALTGDFNQLSSIQTSSAGTPCLGPPASLNSAMASTAPAISVPKISITTPTLGGLSPPVPISIKAPPVLLLEPPKLTVPLDIKIGVPQLETVGDASLFSSVQSETLDSMSKGAPQISIEPLNTLKSDGFELRSPSLKSSDLKSSGLQSSIKIGLLSS